MHTPFSHRLDPAGFTIALHQGRGSARLHLRDFPSEELFDIVLDACLHDRSFDPQCEGSRADWLHSLIARDDRLCAAVIDAFENPAEDQDCFQVANLVGLIARGGNAKAAAALRRLWAENDLAGEVAIIGLDGLPAALDVVRRLGMRLVSDPDEYADCLEFLIADESLRGQVLSTLRTLAPSDAGVAAYLRQHDQRAAEQAEEDRLTPEEREQRRVEYVHDFIAKNPASRIIELAKQAHEIPRGLLVRFGRLAPDSAYGEILQALRSESRPEVQHQLLLVFRSGGLRAWNDTVWRLAHSANEDVRLAATGALKSIADERIGDLARRRVSEGELSAARCVEIDLFVINYRPGDELLILNALEHAKGDADGMHGIGMSALRVCQANPNPQLAGVAVFIYRTNPCTLCRRDIVEWMTELACLPDWVANECRYDASAETRALI